MRVIIALINTSDVVVKIKPEIFSGFTFPTASIVFIPAMINLVFKMKQRGQTVKCLVTKICLMMFGHQTFSFGPELNKGIKPIYTRMDNNSFSEFIGP